MRIIKRLAILTLLLAAMAFVPYWNSAAQTPDSIFVPETGHWIRGAFYQLYQSAPDPLLVFGYPITDELIDPTNGQISQYFQKARFDIIDQAGGQVVQIAPLGTLLYSPGAPEYSIPQNSPTCQKFDQTDKIVCLAFMQFYNEHQGDVFFGSPVSNAEIHNGRIIQYFQRARLEWWPEKQAGQRVILSDLGRIYFDTRVGNAAALAPVRDASRIGASISLHASAFVSKAIVTSNDVQTLYVVAQDEQYSPIQNAAILVQITWPDGHKDTFRPPLTDKNGISAVSFATGTLPQNQLIPLAVTVSFGDLQAQTSTWFRSWN